MASVQSTKPSIFGSEYQDIVNDAETLTASDTYVTRSTLTTSSLKGGTYRLELNFLGQARAANVSLDLQILQDGTTQIYKSLESGNEVSSSQRQARTLVLDDFVLSSGVHTFALGVRSSSDSGGASTGFAQVNYSKLTLFRIS